MTENAVAVIPAEAIESYRMSTNAATICGEIVKATAISIQGRKYVKAEGWSAIAVAHGCVASARDVEKIEGGYRAIGEVRRMSDQALISQAEGFLGDDEQMWAKRPEFARRAMVQTRAISRACRTAFAHVVIMIDKDLGTTPAEEMMGVAPEPQQDMAQEPDVIAAATRWVNDQKNFLNQPLTRGDIAQWAEKQGPSLRKLAKNHPALWDDLMTLCEARKEALKALA